MWARGRVSNAVSANQVSAWPALGGGSDLPVGITLLWTMLCQGMDGTPSAKRAIIVCPTSLVSNWDDECNKWYNPVPQTFGQ